MRAKYFARTGEGRWTFQGTVTDKGGGKHPVSLMAAQAVRIRRHVKVRGDANPYDRSWELYFEERLAAQMASTLTGRATRRYFWLEQGGKCLVCSQPLAREEEWQIHHLRWRVDGGGETADNLVLLHANCHRQVHREGMVVEKAASREGRS